MSPASSSVASVVDRFVAGLFRLGLTWLLAGMLVFVLLPFAAPLLMASGWTGLGESIYGLYAFLCHQLPQRSWFLFGPKLTYTLEEIAQVYPATDAWSLRAFYGTPEMGWKVAWSDRMLSFYTMTPVFGLLYMLLRRLPPQRPLAWRIVVLALLPLAVDGGTHVLNDLVYGISGGGFRDTNAWLAWLTVNAFPGFYAGDHAGTFNWWMRLVSGLVAAWGVAFGLFPWLDRLLQDEWKRFVQNNREKHVTIQENQVLLVRGSARRLWAGVASAALFLPLTWPVWQWLWREWMTNDYYSHGVLIVPVALYLAWRRVAGGRAAQLPLAGDNRGLLLLAASLGLYVFFLNDHAYYLATVAVVGLLTGLVWTLAGRAWVRLWAFPLGYLLLMTPLPFVERVTYPLALLTGISSVWLVRLFGVEVTVVGNAVTLPNADLVIGAQCSGINSLLALVALNGVMAYGVRGPWWGRVSLVGLAVPMAMAGNVLRVAALLAVARAWGADAAFRFYHDYSGIGFFLLVMLLLLPLAQLLQCKSLRHEVL